MTHPRNHHEREFEAFLAGEESELARLYRRLPQSEPDARLDAAVLALARAAVEPQRVNALRHANVRHRRPLWLVALSSAAGVVLATGIAWQMRNGFNESAAPTLQQPASARTERDVIPISAIVPPAEPAAPPPEAPAIASTTAAMPAPPPAKPASLKPKAPAQRREVELAAAVDAKKDNSLRSDDGVPADTSPPERVAAATAQPSAEPLARAGLAEAESTKGSGVDKLAADAAQPQPFPDTAGVPDYNSVERKAALASGSRRDDYGVDVDAASADPLAKQEQRARVARSASKEKRTVEETTARPQSASGAERQVAPSIAAAPPVAASAATPTAEAPQANVSQAPAHSDAASAVGNAASAELKRNAMLAPDEWIKRIRELLRQERRADALENLELLRRKHPTYVVPADLRDLR